MPGLCQPRCLKLFIITSIPQTLYVAFSKCLLGNSIFALVAGGRDVGLAARRGFAQTCGKGEVSFPDKEEALLMLHGLHGLEEHSLEEREREAETSLNEDKSQHSCKRAAGLGGCYSAATPTVENSCIKKSPEGHPAQPPAVQKGHPGRLRPEQGCQSLLQLPPLSCSCHPSLAADAQIYCNCTWRLPALLQQQSPSPSVMHLQGTHSLPPNFLPQPKGVWHN